jgi:hypothetical protein
MDYSRLGLEQKRQIIEQRLVNLEAEHFNQSLSLRQLEKVANGSPDIAKAIADAEAALKGIDLAYQSTLVELESLVPDSAPDE